jgi:hypothetical protein
MSGSGLPSNAAVKEIQLGMPGPPDVNRDAFIDMPAYASGGAAAVSYV